VLVTREGPVTLSEIRSTPARVRVYNLTVEGMHTYAVTSAGLLVHNDCGPGRTPRGQMPEGRTAKDQLDSIEKANRLGGNQWNTNKSEQDFVNEMKRVRDLQDLIDLGY